ncbi:MAG: hypothetical protein R3F38_10125 [Gammaproteobacteria bacterium]
MHRRPQHNDYRLDVFDHGNNRHRFFTAGKVLLAAGTLNTVKLLYRSRDVGGLSGMPALGMGFGGNGDFPALWLRDMGKTDMTLGTPCHGRFALRDYPDCPNLTSYGLNGLDQIPLPGWLEASFAQAVVRDQHGRRRRQRSSELAQRPPAGALHPLPATDPAAHHRCVRCHRPAQQLAGTLQPANTC